MVSRADDGLERNVFACELLLQCLAVQAVGIEVSNVEANIEGIAGFVGVLDEVVKFNIRKGRAGN